MMYNRLYMDTKNLVFYVDIDDTIVDTALQVIESVLNKFPMASKSSARELAYRFQQPASVPEFQQPEILDHINSCLNSADFIRKLRPKQYAATEIKKLTMLGKVTAYISLRSDKLQTVTEQWLVEHEFPQAKVALRQQSDSNPVWKFDYILSETENPTLPKTTVLIEDNHELVALLPTISARAKAVGGFQLWLIGDDGKQTDVHKSTPNLRYFSSLSDVYAKIFTEKSHAQA